MNFSIKSKKIVSSIMAFTMLTAATVAADTSIIKNIIPTNSISAEAASSNGWEYVITGTYTCKMTKYTGTSKTPAVPVAINGHTVTEIGVGAFKNNSRIESVTIPRGITEVPRETFMNCTALKTVYFPPCFDVIGESAFENCNKLASISCTYGPSVVKAKAFKNTGIKKFSNYYNTSGDCSIGAYAFENCHALETVELNGNWSIGNSAFLNCDNLFNIKISNNNTLANAFSTSGFKGANRLTYINGRQLFAIKKGIPYIHQEYASIVERYKTKLRQDNIKLYMDFLNASR